MADLSKREQALVLYAVTLARGGGDARRVRHAVREPVQPVRRSAVEAIWHQVNSAK